MDDQRQRIDRQALDAFGQWMYEFDLGDGVVTPVYMESLKAVHAVRRDMMFGFLDSTQFDYAAGTVLDVACNEGYFLFEFLKRGARSGVGIEGRSDNLAKAEFVKQALGYRNCELRQGDVLATDLGRDAFDVVLLLGIIYHVENPIGLIRRAAAASRRLLFVETQLCRSGALVRFGWGIPGVHHDARNYFVLHDEGYDNPLASMGGLSLVPNLEAVITILRHCGFRSIVQLHPRAEVTEPQYVEVDRVVLVGIK